MPLLAFREFMLICGLGLAVAGLTTYIITWMLVLTHLRDHHPQDHARMSGFLFMPHAFGWFLSGGYARLSDRNLTALARLGRIGAWGILIGLVVVVVSKALVFAGGSA